MRSCVYCGKDLTDGELCQCPQSVRTRQAKTAASDEEAHKNTDSRTAGPRPDQNTYKTGYTKKQKKRFRKKILHTNPIRQKVPDSGQVKSFFSGLWSYVKSFVKDPVNTVSNAVYLTRVQIIVLVVVQALILSLSYYIAKTRLLSGLIRSVNPLFQIGSAGWSVPNLLLTVLVGTIGTGIAIFLLIGVFYCINRFILRRKADFWDFSVRLTAALLPITILGVAGILVGFFSVYALIMLNLAGLLIWLILTYEALKTEWSSLSESHVIYTMALGFFVFLVICFNLIRFF